MSITLDKDKPDKIVGGTDGTIIGNIGDRLKVTGGAGGAAGSGSGVPAYNGKLLYEDANASTGGVARSTAVGATFTNLYSYSGSGLFLGFIINAQTLANWVFKLDIDGNQIFGSSGLSMGDLLSNALYGFGDLDPEFCGLRRSGDVFQYNVGLDHPIEFSTNVTISATGNNKNFLAGLVCISKD